MCFLALLRNTELVSKFSRFFLERSDGGEIRLIQLNQHFMVVLRIKINNTTT